ncbi:type II secretion system F family protein [Nakamurella leprariae]|uniref:Type II secretion system F family protein n=1 Tax=Nakamurella leprariae TaxID=2803911 RepID=A0A938YGJ1_9ACTN|nr:type II secretion system F family protein [Nakamurella leprariae]MBM9467405.1 type II secretion system F family protein [Nakamurella leprariae]
MTAGVAVSPAWWWIWLAVGAGLVVVTRRSSSRRPVDPAAGRWVAATSGLLAECVAGGLDLATGLGSVRRALPPPRAGPSQPRPAAGPDSTLAAVESMLSLGVDPEQAWRLADDDPLVAPIAAAARRSAVSGVALADALRMHADDLERRDGARGRRRDARAGVLVTLPLTLCFLPAFGCLGLAPVVLGLLDQLQLP